MVIWLLMELVKSWFIENNGSNQGAEIKTSKLDENMMGTFWLEELDFKIADSTAGYPKSNMKEQELVTGAQEQVKLATQELAKARSKLDAFEADPQVPSYFQGTPTEYFTFLSQQFKDREIALYKREVALEKERATELSIEHGHAAGMFYRVSLYILK